MLNTKGRKLFGYLYRFFLWYQILSVVLSATRSYTMYLISSDSDFHATIYF
ncbi:unnamed protein product [Paramecium octaurelia]|uniref:Uncharacterized protein n=1 Tax=Paramecium octaurelia TaxID=43137 RepID=A0A8S1U385_PAROT|nr:unnamed protein product [Paramecium octaurelia]